MWYMLLEPKLRLYTNLLGLAPAAPRVRVQSAPASREGRDSLFTRIREKVKDARHRRLAIAELSRLDDRLLRDIGLERARIPEVVDGLVGRGPERSPRVLSRGVASRGARGSFLGRMVADLGRARLRRQAVNGLSRLDDRLLRDIGLERDGIPDAVDAMLRNEAVPAPARRATVHRLVIREDVEDRRHCPPKRAA